MLVSRVDFTSAGQYPGYFSSWNIQGYTFHPLTVTHHHVTSSNQGTMSQSASKGKKKKKKKGDLIFHIVKLQNQLSSL